MTGYGFEDDDVYGDDGQSQASQGKGLRAQLQEVLAKNKALTAKVESFQAASAASRKASIPGVLREAGIDPRAAMFVPDDLEVSKESLAKWAESTGGLFNAAPAETQDGQQAQGQEPFRPAYQGRPDVAPVAQAGFVPSAAQLADQYARTVGAIGNIPATSGGIDPVARAAISAAQANPGMTREDFQRSLMQGSR